MAAIDTLLAQYPAGSKIDTDGFPPDQPYQCFDVAVVYARLVSGNNGLYINCKSSGYVKDWWNDFASNGLSQWFDQIPWDSPGQRGDIAIWGNAPATPYSHIAVLLADNGTTQQIYGQNQPNPYTTIINFTSKGLLGYLRPKGGTDVAIIQNADNWRARVNRTVQAFWGRDFTDAEFQTVVGKDTLNLIEVLGDNPETDNEIYRAKIGAQALDGGWQAQISSLTTQLTKAQADLKTEQDKGTADLATIASLQTTIDGLSSQLNQTVNNPPTTGDAGTKPTAPVNVSEVPKWMKSVGQFLQKLFKKGK